MMTIYAEPILSHPVHQIFKIGIDTTIRAIRGKIISFNDPTFVDMIASIYLVRGGVLLDKVCDSKNAILKSDIESNSINEVFFEFDLKLIKDSRFAIVIEPRGYTPSEISHLALVRAWPKPVYSPYVSTISNQFSAPIHFGFIGGI